MVQVACPNALRCIVHEIPFDDHEQEECSVPVCDGGVLTYEWEGQSLPATLSEPAEEPYLQLVSQTCACSLTGEAEDEAERHAYEAYDDEVEAAYEDHVDRQIHGAYWV